MIPGNIGKLSSKDRNEVFAIYPHGKKFGAILSLLVYCFFYFLILSGCSTTSVTGYGYTSNYFEKQGWMEVNRFEPGENTPYKRITYEMKKNKRVAHLITDKGVPDYYFTTDLWDVYYGYKSSGIIYHIDTRHHGGVIEQFDYTQISSLLPTKILDGFEREKAKEDKPAPPEQESENIICTGTGFFITDDGYLLTNYHVLQASRNVYIYLHKEFYQAEIVAVDESNDIALLKVDQPSSGLPINFANSDKGEEIAAFGFPLIGLQGNELKTTFGHINSLSGIGGDIRYFQIDTPVQPGSSGGPLTNNYGEVIGIVSATLSQKATLATAGTINQNVNYAVKIGYALPMAKQYNIQLVKANHRKELSTTELVQKTSDSVVIVVSKK